MSVAIKFDDSQLNLDLDEENECLVCYDELTNENTVKLACGHKFHYDCIVDSYRMNTNHKQQCPYCRKNGGWLKLPFNKKAYRYVHKEFYKQKSMKIQCAAILKSGANKGFQCKCQAKTNGYCGRHYKIYCN